MHSRRPIRAVWHASSMVEQGLSLTIYQCPHPCDEPEGIETFDALKSFYSVRRIWFGEVPVGGEWLHEALEREFGEDRVWYEVQTTRKSTHVGAAGEVVAVVLVLFGAGALAAAKKIGEELGSDFADWARAKVRQRREEFQTGDFETSPNFDDHDLDGLAEGMKGELADVIQLPERRLQLVSKTRRRSLSLEAIYRDRETGMEYAAEVGRDEAIFRRMGEPRPPDSLPTIEQPDEIAIEAPVPRGRLRLPWRRQ